ncbi:MAG: hemin uptake protein HemP [Planctomycetaceae bacterium]|nr:hemin uptake protein HemP [Planctomycetaceae bacterium]
MEESSPRMVNSRDLLDGRRELRIRHRGEIYRMLLTRNGKLMLQK